MQPKSLSEILKMLGDAEDLEFIVSSAESIWDVGKLFGVPQESIDAYLSRAYIRIVTREMEEAVIWSSSNTHPYEAAMNHFNAAKRYAKEGRVQIPEFIMAKVIEAFQRAYQSSLTMAEGYASAKTRLNITSTLTWKDMQIRKVNLAFIHLQNARKFYSQLQDWGYHQQPSFEAEFTRISAIAYATYGGKERFDSMLRFERFQV